MRVFHSKHFFSANSTHNVSTNRFGLPKVELSNLIEGYFSILYEIVAMAIPFLCIGHFYLVKLAVYLKSLVMRVAQVIAKDLFTFSEATYWLLPWQQLLILIEVLLVIALVLANACHLLIHMGHLLMFKGLDLMVKLIVLRLMFAGYVVICHFDLYVFDIITEMLDLSLALH